jgi:hypothetical protein
VRGSSAPDAELAYILRHARPSGLVVQDPATLQRLLDAGALGGPGAPALKFAVVLWPEAAAKAKGRAAADGAAAAAAAADALAALAAAAPCPVASLQDVLAAGRAAREGGAPFQPYAAGRDDVATLVYTSGTTGEARRVLAGGRGEGAGWRLNAGPASGTVVNDKVTTCDDPTPPRATPQTPAAPPPPRPPQGRDADARQPAQPDRPLPLLPGGRPGRGGAQPAALVAHLPAHRGCVPREPRSQDGAHAGPGARPPPPWAGRGAVRCERPDGCSAMQRRSQAWLLGS